MHNALAMKMFEASDDMGKVKSSCFKVEVPTPLKQIPEVSSSHVLHDHVKVLRSLKCVHTAYYEVTVYLIENISFIHNEISDVKVNHCGFIHHFDRK